MKKRLLSMILTVCMVLILLPGFTLPAMAAANGTGITGSGTEGSPYIITTADQLAYVAQQVNANGKINSGTVDAATAYYELGSNIDLTAYSNWTPIGWNATFKGKFDGVKHSISNLKINTTSTANNQYYGLFGNNQSGTIINVSLTGINITVTNNANAELCVGGLVGYNDGTILNCSATGTLAGSTNSSSTNYTYWGGLVGKNSQGILKNCYSAVSVSVAGVDKPYDMGTPFVGGVAGRNTANTAGRVLYNYWLYSLAEVPTGVDSMGGDNDRSLSAGFTGTDKLNGEVTVGGTKTLSLREALNAGLGILARTDLYTWISGGSYPVLGSLWEPPTYTATVTVQKNGSAWSNSDKSFALYQSGTWKYNMILSGSSATVSALAGTYDVYDGASDTGVNLAVSSGGGAATVNYCTLTLSAGTGTSAPNGSGVYLPGKSVPINAAVNAGYQWSKWTSSNVALLSDQTTKSVSITMPAAPITLTATAVPIQYTIGYSLNGGTVPSENPATYTVASTEIKFNTPTRDGYTFVGWTGSNGETAQTSVTIPTGSTENKTYTANWMADTYNITYTLNGGTVDTANPANYTVESTAINLNNPTRAGFTFLGWTGSNSTTAQTDVSIPTGSTGDKTYTANWTADTYNITYTLNGGTVDTANPANYTVESPVINLNPPTRIGYSFLGWTGSNSTTAQTDVSIPTSSTGNKIYTANWKANKPDKAPATSIVTAKTDTSLTITTQDGYEYSLNGTDWYSGAGSYSFTDLDAGTPYNLVYRKAAVDTLDSAYAASEASDALSVTTKTSSAPAPAAPTIGTGADKPTSDSITVSTAENNEYYISTSSTAPTSWPASGNDYFKAADEGNHTFTGLTAGTQHYIHVRVAETDTAMPSASTYAAQYTLPVTPEVSVVTINYVAETINFANTYEVSTSASFNTTIANGSTLQPVTTYYIRVKAASGAPASEAVSIITTARPVTPDAIKVTNITRTHESIIILNTVTTQEYSVDGGMTWKTGNNNSLTFNGLDASHAYSVVTRIPAMATAFASSSASALPVTTKAAPASLSDSGVTYNVKDGTVTGLGSTYEYSLDNGTTWQTAPVTGVSFAAGNVIQVRTKETDDAMPSLPQTLGTIDALAAAPAYGIDFTSEKTTVSVPATVEYNTSSATSTTWMAGEDTPLPLTPGTTYYFRVAATDTALAGNVQTLENPARPAAPDVSVITITAGEDASHTVITLADTYEYILANALPDVSALGTAGTDSASEIAAVAGHHVYIRVKATVSAFASDWMDCGEVQLGVDDINLAGVGYDVAAGTLTGTTTNMQYSMDGGSIWQDCAAGNTIDLTFVACTVKIRQKDKPTNEHTVGIIAPVEISADPMLHSKSYDSVTLTAMSGYEYSKDGGATWQDSNIFTKLRSGTKYSFVSRIKATAATLPGTVSASMTVTTNNIFFDDINTGDSSTPTGAPVIVDGKTVNIGAENKTADTTTVTVDQSKLGENINGAAAGSSVVVPVSENIAATASLVVKNIEDMAQKGMTLTVQTGSVAYNLNTSAIDTAALTAAFPGADMSKVPFDVTIQNSSVSVEGETLVLSPVAFTVTATFNGKTVSVDIFSAYINRMIEVTEKQAAKITTAVVVNADGSTRHVPTNVIEKDGKYYAIINSRTNSTYALIQNEVTFADASGEWYEAAVNEMGSRKIIDGRSVSFFKGGASITRAEFAAILIRALGLPADGTSSFSDVPTTAWYSGAVATASQYELVAGKGNNRFDPNANITRQEAMLMLYRASALTEFDGTSGALDGFADADSIGSWAKDAMKWSVGSGLIQGSDGKLNPTAYITRAESAVIILRLLQKAGLVDIRS